MLGCASGPADPASLAPEPALVLWALEVENHGDGRDIAVRLVPPSDASSVAELRVYLLEPASVAGFDETAASAAPPTSFLTVAFPTAATDVNFLQGSTTVAGGAITTGETYAVVIESVPASDGAPSAFSEAATVTLARTHLVKTLTGTIQAGTGGMDADAEGNIYFADFGASLDGPPGTVVYRITPEGAVTTWATGLAGASGNAFGSNGDLFQSNIAGGTVSRITPAGSVSTHAEGLAGGPVGIAATPGDTLYVVNCGRNRIHRVEPDGSQSVWIESSLFSCPNGITRASDGNFYVANFGNGGVIRVTPQGNVSTHAVLPGGNNGHILFGNGVLYVVARGANRIYEVTLDGDFTVLAGTGERGLRDGSALSATLSVTNDVALSPTARSSTSTTSR